MEKTRALLLKKKDYTKLKLIFVYYSFVIRQPNSIHLCDHSSEAYTSSYFSVSTNLTVIFKPHGNKYKNNTNAMRGDALNPPMQEDTETHEWPQNNLRTPRPSSTHQHQEGCTRLRRETRR